jgi:quercetin dioxygenase-like cupin family protein
VPDDRYLINSYLDWAAEEGIPIHQDMAFDLRKVEVAPWARMGGEVLGAFTHLNGRGDFANAYVLELPPGTETTPQKHLFEEVVYVVAGHGSTTVEDAHGKVHTFEWQQGSLFALPLNARYQHFNVSGEATARLGVVTNLPMVLNVFHNHGFVFDNPFAFDDRFGPDAFFGGDGRSLEIAPGRHQWVTNFVADLPAFQLKSWGERGVGSSNIKFVLADGTMHAHMSELAVGTYKKAHRHGPDFHIFPTTGEGYSLFWYEGDTEFTRVDWGQGSLYAPADQQFHQHFNVSPEPSRYLAVAMGSMKYPVTSDKFGLFGGGVDRDVKRGGRQLEYKDENPAIREMFESELRARGIEVDPRLRKEWEAA